MSGFTTSLKIITNFLSNSAWAGWGVIIAIVAFAIPTFYFFVDRAQNTANIEYWINEHHVSTRLPSGEMWIPSEYGLLIGVRNNGPAAGEGVLVTVQSGDNIVCDEIGTGILIDETLQPTRFSSSPYMCEYFYEYLYSGYSVTFLVNRSSDTHVLNISVTGINLNVTDISSITPQ